MINQPTWRLLWASDDRAVYTDDSGVYPAEMAIGQTCDDSSTTFVYRFPLERRWIITNNDGSTFLTDMDPSRADLPYPLTTYVPWFHNSLGDVARSVGSTVSDLTSALCSDDPGTLAEVYDAIGGYHGFANFDGYPQEWNQHEFASWPDRGPKTDPAVENTTY